MTAPNLLCVRHLSLDTPEGRPLFRNLDLTLGRGERVALVGRNGVGKSSLLDVLAGRSPPTEGSVLCHGRRRFVPQRLEEPPTPARAAGASPGEWRRRVLEEARLARPDLLLLDEPTHDLDARGVAWLSAWIDTWPEALLVVSHARSLLRSFHEFFIAAESGCRHFSGSLDALLGELEREREEQEERYVGHLNRLLTKEQHNATVWRRRQRKKNLGRLHEIARAPSRAKLNSKRAYAQVSQGKRALLQQARLDAAREWARAARRALRVELPLELALPRLPDNAGPPVATLRRVAAQVQERVLFADVSLELRRDRLAITGPNGSGKTTLLEILTGLRQPDAGQATCDRTRTGYVAQNSSNWQLSESLVDHLTTCAEAVTPETVAQTLRAHKFPLALAERPLRSLSPGECLRAALICLCQRRPAPELLILDEPTDHLDFVGTAALERFLSTWRGGLLVVSHDHEFLRALGVERRLDLGESTMTNLADSVIGTPLGSQE